MKRKIFKITPIEFFGGLDRFLIIGFNTIVNEDSINVIANFIVFNSLDMPESGNINPMAISGYKSNSYNLLNVKEFDFENLKQTLVKQLGISVIE